MSNAVGDLVIEIRSASKETRINEPSKRGIVRTILSHKKAPYNKYSSIYSQNDNWKTDKLVNKIWNMEYTEEGNYGLVHYV